MTSYDGTYGEGSSAESCAPSPFSPSVVLSTGGWHLSPVSTVTSGFVSASSPRHFSVQKDTKVEGLRNAFKRSRPLCLKK